jgi:uncharacterized protein
MPRRDSAPVGAPCWIELSTSDPDRSRAFYGELLGWTSEQMGDDYGSYINFAKDGERIAGAMANDPASGQPDGWLTYLASADAKATVDAAQAAGGQVVVDAMDVMEMGTMAVVIDPGGAGIGIWQPGTHPGFLVLAEPGAPAWFELHTGAYDASVDFYRKVFGWNTQTASDTNDFRYTTLDEGDDAKAGIMDQPDVPPHWAVYFAVADTDAAVAKAVGLGAAVVTEAQDTPYGRLAELTDPTGATFRLIAD